MSNSNLGTQRSEVESLLRDGKFDAAAALCEAWVLRSPDEAEGWFWLGYVRLLQGDLARAELALAEAIRLDPSRALTWTNLSIVALGRGRAAEAEGYARRAIEL